VPWDVLRIYWSADCRRNLGVVAKSTHVWLPNASNRRSVSQTSTVLPSARGEPRAGGLE